MTEMEQFFHDMDTAGISATDLAAHSGMSRGPLIAWRKGGPYKSSNLAKARASLTEMAKERIETLKSIIPTADTGDTDAENC